MSLTRGGGVNSGLLGVLLAAAACHLLTSCRACSQALTNILDVGSIYETNTICQVVYTAGGMLLANHSMPEQQMHLHHEVISTALHTKHHALA
jgi:hypothetical protein